MKWEYLQPADRPVVDGLEGHEVVYAKDQPEYIPLRCLRSNAYTGSVLSRWTLTPEQRQLVAEGGDIFLELLTFGHPLQPIMIAVGNDPEPWFFEDRYQLRLGCGCIGRCKGHSEQPPEPGPKMATLEIQCLRCGKYNVKPQGHCPGCGWVWSTAPETKRPRKDRDDRPPQPDRHHA
ncbi:MAG: hypothetical protein C4529_14985 [Deltaproteobacteria bacterium]|nr:MAG: hypothetical protein C4529_14985 [Deltaproteobacteria bacterium]